MMCDCSPIEYDDLKPGDVLHFGKDDDMCRPTWWWVVLDTNVIWPNSGYDGPSTMVLTYDQRGGVHVASYIVSPEMDDDLLYLVPPDRMRTDV